MDPDVDVALLVRAIEFAARKHRLQRRKDVEASPFINHPVALMSVLCVEAGVCDVEVLSAAALHDTIEDTQTTRDEISREFGKKIADIVAELTDDKSLPKEERKRLQIEKAPHKSPAASLVTMADKIANLRFCVSYLRWPMPRGPECEGLLTVNRRGVKQQIGVEK